jgi:hypothetical protein
MIFVFEEVNWFSVKLYSASLELVVYVLELFKGINLLEVYIFKIYFLTVNLRHVRYCKFFNTKNSFLFYQTLKVVLYFNVGIGIDLIESFVGGSS